MEWPEWWEWEIELTAHVEERMIDRSFNEVDLRLMLENATGWRADHVEGRFVIETVHDDDIWNVIVEPIEDEQTLVIITAYSPD